MAYLPPCGSWCFLVFHMSKYMPYLGCYGTCLKSCCNLRKVLLQVLCNSSLQHQKVPRISTDSTEPGGNLNEICPNNSGLGSTVLTNLPWIVIGTHMRSVLDFSNRNCIGNVAEGCFKKSMHVLLNWWWLLRKMTSHKKIQEFRLQNRIHKTDN